MKHLCCVRVISLFLGLSLFVWAGVEKKSAIVYYGKDIPYTLVGIHDYIIVQPDHINTYLPGFKRYRDDMYAYVSIGEIEKGQSYYNDIKSSWIIAENKIWNSKVMDISNKFYHEFMFKKVIDPLIKKGFKNFFFDTLDSYLLAAKTPEDKIKMQEGLVTFIKNFDKRYPKAKLIINRGFEVIDQVHTYVDAVLVESLFEGLSIKDLSYKSVSVNDRKWLMEKLDKVKGYNLPIIIVDYVSPKNKILSQKTVKAIQSEGFIPYVGDKDLNTIGYTSKTAKKREVLLLYDSTEFEGTENDDKYFSTSFLQLSMPLEYMGYIPKLYDVSAGIPSSEEMKRFAGAIIWLTGQYHTKNPKVLLKWVTSIMQQNIKLLFLETLEPAIHKKLFKKLDLGLSRIDTFDRGKTKIVSKGKYMGLEIDPYIIDTGYLFKPKGAIPLCKLNQGKKSSTIAAITPWGGYVFEGAAMRYSGHEGYWIVDPFKIIRESLRLAYIPVPDPTTENGRRLLFSHVDGDGIMNRVEWNPKLFSGEVLYEEILKRYNIPVSVSIIESETAPYGLYPDNSQQLEEIAKKIFTLENVEAATHTYTHPFFWRKIINDNLDPKYRLKVKNYNFSVDREINGSLEYINNTLISSDKKTKMTFWSGDCNPTKTTLEYMYQNDYLHINGGDTTITNADSRLSLISPFGIEREGYYQIFTGAQNENVYTNDWIGPFWGFKKVIQTFKLTDKPRRLKPIDIYYHIYSGSKRASVNALQAVYKWSVKQDVMPIFTSEYPPKVLDFYHASIMKESDGWVVKGMNALKTVRMPIQKYIDIARSKGVVGYKKYNDSLYMHLDTSREHHIVTSKTEHRSNYLIDANAALVSNRQTKNEIQAQFSGHVPVELRYHVLEGCSLTTMPKADNVDQNDRVFTISYQKQKDVNVSVVCR